MESTLRTVACWSTIAVSIWSLSYYFVYGTEEGSAFIIEDLTVPLMREFDISWENGARLVMLITPTLVLTTLCTLIVTSAPLTPPSANLFKICINRIFSRFRKFSGGNNFAGDGLNKKNQFGLGEINFNIMSFCLVSLPCTFFFLCTLNKVLSKKESSSLLLEDSMINQQQHLKAIANAMGMAGTLALSFFLIPVSRHSILLVAIGWSPLQALRIHIWAGYTSFVFILLHGLIHFIVWIQKHQDKDGVTLWNQIWPDSSVCWEWDPVEPPPRECRIQWYNFSGLVAFFFFAILIVTSLNWFRRRYYKLFYIFHIVCGIGMLGGAVMHWRPIITYIAPSIIYYFASTTPALVQALTSRLRGGVKVVKVIHLEDAGGCKEIHIATTSSANTALDIVPSMYIKMCVPSISLVWHPFTVFKHPQDPLTVRILFRPVGPFTKALANSWEEEEDGEQQQQTPPKAVIIDGFYHAGNRSLEVIHHDHVIFYCGGVAITPFLSLIPNLLGEIAKQKQRSGNNHNEAKIKKVVFIWACREEGLASYITENYLKGMKNAANAIEGFAFDCIVYHTQRKKKACPLGPPIIRKDNNNNDNDNDNDNNHYHHDYCYDDDGMETSSNLMDTTFLSDLTLDQENVGRIQHPISVRPRSRLASTPRTAKSSSSSASSSSPSSSSVQSQDQEEPSSTRRLFVKHQQEEEEKDKGEEEQSWTEQHYAFQVSEYNHSKGVGAAHDMELHRFMPARHNKIWYNIPALVAVGGSLWILFYIIFYYYHGYDIHVHEFYDRLWPLILCFLISIGSGLVFEGINALVGAFCSQCSSVKQQGGDGKRGTRPNNSSGYLLVDEEEQSNSQHQHQHRHQHQQEDSAGLCCEMVGGAAVAVEHRNGRPDVVDIFRECRRAECPGIFMCGPPAMTEKVRQEAGKENTIFGLTRYALYEDPFEM